MNRLPLLQINTRQFIYFLFCLLFCFLSPPKQAARPASAVQSSLALAPIKIAFLNVNESAEKFSARFAGVFAQQKNFKLLDESLSQAAARGIGNQNLFNLSLDEAKNLGTAIDCDFYFIIKSETLRRSSFARNLYFESYAVVFLVSTRSGKLIDWKDVYFEAETTDAAENLLIENSAQQGRNFVNKVLAAAQTEKNERTNKSPAREALQIVELSDAESALEQNYRIPLPYKNLHPVYTEAARRLEIEATVDVAVNLNEDGEVSQTEIVRWAGFDLDEEVVKTVKRMHFRPALRDNRPLAVRILLRYNFHDLSRKNEEQ